MEDKIVIEQYYKLRSCRAVAELYQCSEETIRRILKANGIKLTGWKKPERTTPKKKYPSRYVPVSYQVVCKCCGKEFTSHRKTKIYCSRKCRDVGYKRSKGQDSRLEARHVTCAICGKEFDTTNATKKTCSAECKRLLKHNWKEPKEPLQKQCEICGKAFSTYHDAQKTCGAEDCKIKYKAYAHKIRNEREKEQNAEIKAVERKWMKAIHTVERECKVCGTLFYCLDKEPNVTCSHECSVEWARQQRHLKADKRINKDNLVDYGITLEKIYARDNGICHICGGKCDWNDYQMRDGIKICGRAYPSKDHVIPLARGGKHSWENVRLAHWWCNSVVKNDTTPTFTKEMSREQARKFAIERGFGKKKTAQYTLTGELVRVWESTAEIQREFGWSDSSIQSACRGEQRTSHGFVWRYVG